MKSIVSTYSRNISIFILITVLLCSVFGPSYEVSMSRDTNVPVAHGIFTLHSSIISEIINVEEISDSTSQAAFLRQLYSRTSNYRYIWANITGIILAPVVLIALLAFLSLCTGNVKKTHRFIMDFIHKKDGKKL